MGLTWKEFKDDVERHGIKDDWRFDYLSVGDIESVSDLDISPRPEAKRFRVDDRT